MYNCKICGEDDQDWWRTDYIFGALCQDCHLKYTIRLMEVAKEICDKEIEKIKQERKADGL